MSRFSKRASAKKGRAAEPGGGDLADPSAGARSLPAVPAPIRSKHDDRIFELCARRDHNKLRQIIAKSKFSKGQLHSPNQYGGFAVLEACKFGAVACLEVLLDVDPDISHCRDESGRAAVHMAAELGFVDIMRVLAKRGVDVELVDSRGLTPLHLAAQEGRADIVQQLLGCSVPTEPRTADGSTPLILACIGGHGDAAERLINGGADVDATNNQLRTPLMSACDSGLTAAVKLLVDRGAKINMKDSNGTTARELATIKGFDGCIAALPDSAYLGNLAASVTAGGREGTAPAVSSGEQLVADMASQIAALRKTVESVQSRLAAAEERASLAERERDDAKIQLATFGTAEAADDDLNFDDDDDLLEVDSGADKVESIISGLTPEARELVQSLRREATAARFEVVTLTEQLQGLGAIPSVTSAVATVSELSNLRKKNEDLNLKLASLSGDVVPLSIFEQLKAQGAQEVEALREELQDATTAVVSAATASEDDIDALIAKVTQYRRLLLLAIQNNLPEDVRKDLNEIVAATGASLSDEDEPLPADPALP